MNVMGLAIVAVLALLAFRYFRDVRPKRKTRSAFQELLAACDGDQDLAERLVFAEVQKAPDLDLGEAARRARKRLLKDRH